MKILICDQQRMLAEAPASALSGHGYDILAVTTTVSGVAGSVGDWVTDVCLLGLQPGRQSSGPDAVRAIEASRTIIGLVAGESAAAVAPTRYLTEVASAARREG